MNRTSAYKLSGIMAAVLAATALGASAQVPSTTTPGPDVTGQVPGQATAPGTVAPSTVPAPLPQTPNTAATPNPTMADPAEQAPMDDVGTASSSIAIIAPKEFMRQAFLANEFGIAAAQLAVDKGSSPEVRETAKGVLDNGMKTRSDMIVAIQGSTSDMHFDQSWTDELKQDLAELQTLEGAEFDARYIETQGELNNTAQELYQTFAGTATDESVKTFTSNALPVLSADGDSLEAVAQGGQ